ncbi:MAG: 1-phosphofructokinase [Oligoflexales bacterium]|nr:1-phosphofructokinase [Oligoflexales bacterium]
MIITVSLNPAIDKTVEIDNFEIGRVNRISSLRRDAGGKGINVSKTILTLTGKSRAVGVLAGTSGQFIRQTLDTWGIENDFLFIEGETRTNLKVIDKIKRTNTDINEAGPSVDDEILGKVGQKILGSIKKGDILVLSGSLPPMARKNIYADWTLAARQKGAITILDADGEPFKSALKASPYLIKPNIHELEAYHGEGIRDIKKAAELGRRILIENDISIVSVSLGENGALFLSRHETILAHGLPVKVRSTVGAGDAMVGAMAYGLEQGYELERMITLAIACGSASVMTEGSEPFSPENVAELQKNVKYETVV